MATNIRQVTLSLTTVPGLDQELSVSQGQVSKLRLVLELINETDGKEGGVSRGLAIPNLRAIGSSFARACVAVEVRRTLCDSGVYIYIYIASEVGLRLRYVSRLQGQGDTHLGWIPNSTPNYP